jgi:hypothetical protein
VYKLAFQNTNHPEFRSAVQRKETSQKHQVDEEHKLAMSLKVKNKEVNDQTNCIQAQGPITLDRSQ